MKQSKVNFLRYSLANEPRDLDEYLSQVLDTMFPPCSTADGHLYAHASRVPSTRLDVLDLTNQLNDALKRNSARSVGLCSIRQSLYDSLFDELIRQVTVNCIEQGLLLFRIRNQLKMTLAAYETVYLSGIRYGLREAMKDKNVSAEARAQQTILSSDREHLRGELFRLQKQLIHEREQSHNQLTSLTHQWTEETNHLKDQIIKQSRLLDSLRRRPVEL